MFKKRSKRNLQASGSERKDLKLWSIGEDNRRLLLTTLPVFINKLKTDALGEEHLFIRKVGTDDESPEEEFEIIENAIKGYFIEYNNGADGVHKLLEHYSVHVWANIVKEILKIQSPQTLLPEPISTKLLELSGENRVERINKTKLILEDMPHSRWNIFRDLCVLVRECAAPSDKLCFVFGVLLLLTREEFTVSNCSKSASVKIKSPQEMRAIAETCTETMSFLIDSCYQIFNITDAATTHSSNSSSTGNSAQERLSQRLSLHPREYSSSFASSIDDRSMESSTHSESRARNLVKVLYDLEPESPDELPLVKDDWINVIAKHNEEWYEGQYTSASGQVLRGLFPGSYVDMSSFTNDLSARSTTSSPVPTYTSESENIPLRKVIVFYAYEASEDIELSLKPNEVLTLLDDTDEDWWSGRTEDGREGLFPKNYVQIVDSSGDSNKEGHNKYVNDWKSLEQKQYSQSQFEISNAELNSAIDYSAEDKLATGMSNLNLDAPTNQTSVNNNEIPFHYRHIHNPQQQHEKRRSATREIARGGSDRFSIELNKSEPIVRGPPPPTPSRTTAAVPIRITRNIRNNNVISQTNNGNKRPLAPATAPQTQYNKNWFNSEQKQSMGMATQQSSWKIDKGRFTFCVGWFMKLAKPDASGRAMVAGRDAAEFILKSGLRKDVVARILELSDIDGDKMFDRDEFVVAHHLAISIKKGMPEPKTLPEYLIPASKRSIM